MNASSTKAAMSPGVAFVSQCTEESAMPIATTTASTPATRGQAERRRRMGARVAPSSGVSRKIATYSQKPAPPRNASPTKAIRSSSGSTPNCAPRPLHTPATRRPLRVRTKRRSSGMRKLSSRGDRARRVPARPARVTRARRRDVERNGSRDVAQHALAARLQHDVLATQGPLARGAPELVRHEHLAGAGEGGNARGNVDGGAEEVAVALDGGTVVDTDANARVARPRESALRDARAGGDSLGGIGDAHHDGVAERLDDVRVDAQLLLDAEAQARGELGGGEVAVLLGVGGEADDVGEQERCGGELDRRAGEHGRSVAARRARDN